MSQVFVCYYQRRKNQILRIINIEDGAVLTQFTVDVLTKAPLYNHFAPKTLILDNPPDGNEKDKFWCWQFVKNDDNIDLSESRLVNDSGVKI